MTKTTEEKANTMNIARQSVYYVVFAVTAYESLEDAFAKAPDMIAAHIKRSKEFQARGTILMAGAFLNNPQGPESMMAIATTREAAEEYIKGDPFVLAGQVRTWYIREWANIFA